MRRKSLCYSISPPYQLLANLNVYLLLRVWLTVGTIERGKNPNLQPIG